MTCTSCHTTVPPAADFCPKCGAKAGATGPATPPRSARPGGTFSGLDTVNPMRDKPSSVLANGSIFANRYEVLSKIGEGGMGVVYLTRDTNTGDEVVLKLIHPDLVAEEAVKRLMAEGVTARQIRHPNIVAVFDVAQWEGQPYFTMEHVKGGSLRSWLVKQTRDGALVPLATAIGLVKAMLAGLGEAHRMNVVHRDLKPENVLLVTDPAGGVFDLKLLDFGIARAISGPLSTGRASGPAGTRHYMAPEQQTSAEVAGPTADFYSITVMLYELLVGVVPQAPREPISRLRPEIPQALDALIDQGLTAMARNRFGSAADYTAKLDAVLENAAPRPEPVPQPDPDPRPEPVPDPPFPPREREGNWWSHLSAKAKAGVVGGVIVLGVIASVINPDPPPNPQPYPPAPIPGPGPSPEPEPPPRPSVRALPNIAGQWVHRTGLAFNVGFRGRSFGGPGNGGQRIEGIFDNDWNAAFSVWDNANNLIFQTRDGRLVDTGTGFHLQYANGSETLFVNHAPH